ncbi:MAG: HlyD family secretion protein [Dysgonomonas sp.]
MDIDNKLETEKEKEEIREAYRKLRNKRRRNYILNSISILLALGGVIWACTFFYRYYKFEITNDATVEQYITPINSRITGYVKEVLFTEHQWVNAGDTLLIIDDREFKIRLTDAEASLLDARNSGSVLSSSISTSASNVAVSDANIEESKARLWRAEQDLKRYANLLEAESVSQQQYDQMKSEYDAQKAHYNALLRQKESLKSVSVETSKKQGNVEANVLRHEADVEMAKLNLSYTVITAPYSGYVGRRTLDVGQLVQAGQTITNLIKNENKWVIANYREKQIGNIHIGQEVRCKIDAFDSKVFKGKVTAISEATGSKYSMLPTDNSAGNFVKIQQRIPVRIEFENMSPEDMKNLRAGMMVIVEAIK